MPSATSARRAISAMRAPSTPDSPKTAVAAAKMASSLASSRCRCVSGMFSLVLGGNPMRLNVVMA